MSENTLTQRIPCEVYSRVVGYITPTHLWNAGKKAEWRERQIYDLPSADANKSDDSGAITEIISTEITP